MSYRMFAHKTKIIEGCGCLAEIGNEIKKLRASRVLIVTDRYLASTEYFRKITESLDRAGVDWISYEGVTPNPNSDSCDELAEVAAERKVDLVVGFGGGSAMDQAKAVAAAVTNHKTCREMDGVPLEREMLPVVCVPTTSGTGSEVTCVAVITDEKVRYKMSIYDQDRLAPSLAICDPDLTLSLPPGLTAECGIDALTHAVEAFTCRSAQPVTDGLALQAASMILTNLPRAVQYGDDIEARTAMMQASTMAGMAFIHSNVAAVHAIAETVGAMFHVPHGLANAIFLPYVLELNLPAAAGKYAVLEKTACGGDCPAAGEEVLAERFLSRVKALIRQLGIRKFMDIEGVRPEEFEVAAFRASLNELSLENIIPVSADDYLDMLEHAYGEG